MPNPPPVLALAAVLVLIGCAREPATVAQPTASTASPTKPPACPNMVHGPSAPLSRGALPAPSAITAADIRPFAGGAPMSLEELKHLFSHATVVDPCDPSVDAWQYAPAQRGTFTADGETRHLQLFLGGRGIVETESGTRIMFDTTPE